MLWDRTLLLMSFPDFFGLHKFTFALKRMEISFCNDLGQRVPKRLTIHDPLSKFVSAPSVFWNHLVFLGRRLWKFLFYFQFVLRLEFIVNSLAGDGRVAILKWYFFAEVFRKALDFDLHLTIPSLFFSLVNYHIFEGFFNLTLPYAPLFLFLRFTCDSLDFTVEFIELKWSSSQHRINSIIHKLDFIIYFNLLIPRKME